MRILINSHVIILVLIQICIKLSYERQESDVHYSITVDLQQTGPKDVYINNFTIVGHSTPIFVINLNNYSSFFIIQIHSYIEQVTLSYSIELQHTGYVSGTNIGLYWGKNEKCTRSSTFYIKRTNTKEPLDVLVIVSTYEKDDPVPGGCNLSFDTEYAPYQKVIYDNDLITALAQPPSLYQFSRCKEDNISTVAFYMRIEAKDVDEGSYFETIKKMSTEKQIYKHATLVNSYLSNTYKQLYNKYKGLGYVRVLVSTYNNRSSLYVPIISFGCNISNWDNDCIGSDGAGWMTLYVCFIFIGLYISFFGQVLFTTSVYLGVYKFVVLLALCLQLNFFFKGELTISLVISLIIATVLVTALAVYRRFFFPRVYMLCNFILFGCLLASTCLYRFDTLQLSGSNWLFFSLVIIPGLLLYLTGRYGHMTVLTFLGSFAFVAGIGLIFGGYLQYIYINTFRRFTVNNFYTAIIDPPFTTFDIWCVLLWSAVCILGVYVQYRLINKPEEVGGTEEAPLLGSDVISEISSYRSDYS